MTYETLRRRAARAVLLPGAALFGALFPAACGGGASAKAAEPAGGTAGPDSNRTAKEPAGTGSSTAPGGGAPAAAAANVPDTALLTPEAARVAGFGTDTARRVPWRAAWATPARLALDPVSTQALGSIVQGRVLRVLVLPGDRVRRGQVLATLHSEEMLTARAQLTQAEAGVLQATSDVRVATEAAARAERLYAGRAGALADVERARGARVDALAQQRRAQAELARAREFFGHLVGEGPPPPRDRSAGADADLDVLVRAPFDGLVVTRDAQPGAVVNVGAPLLTVTRAGTLALVLRLPEQALGTARPGAVVRFTVPAYPKRAFTARVARVAPALDSLSRTAEVIASVPNADGALKAEMTAAAELLGPAGEPTLAVKDAAVQEFQGDTVVVTARPGPNGASGRGVVLQAVPVRPGRRAQGLAEIVAGLTPGTAVVTEGVGIAKAEIQRRRDQRNGGGGGGGD